MNDVVAVPEIATIGLFDLKMKFGNVALTEKRRVYAYEIELPTEDGGVSYINGKEYEIDKSRIICAKPGQTRRTKAPFVCRYIHLIPDDNAVSRMLDTLPDIISLTEPEKYIALFDEILSDYSETAHRTDLRVFGKVLILIDMLLKDAEISMAESRYSGKANIGAVKQALLYIDANYMNKITLDELADRVFLSPIYFRKLFYDTVGVSPYGYILDKRLENAKKLLRSTDMPISHIAYSSGFSDQAYFGSVFKKATKMTPREYRVSMNNMYP